MTSEFSKTKKIKGTPFEFLRNQLSSKIVIKNSPTLLVKRNFRVQGGGCSGWFLRYIHYINSLVCLKCSICIIRQRLKGITISSHCFIFPLRSKRVLLPGYASTASKIPLINLSKFWKNWNLFWPFFVGSVLLSLWTDINLYDLIFLLIWNQNFGRGRYLNWI